MRTVAAVGMALVMLSACGGELDEPGPPRLPLQYVKSTSDWLMTTGPNTVEMLAVSCEPTDAILEGGCEVGAGGTVVQNAPAGHGWGCSATSARDQVTLRVWVRCGR